MLIAGTANPGLAEAIAADLGRALTPVTIERFPDQELHVELQQSPRGRDVFLLQPTSPPPDAHLLEVLALADACRRGGAACVTAVIPYFGYARQDRRARGVEAVTARLVADLLVASGIQRLVTLDLHTDAIEGFFTIPVERLSAVPTLAAALAAVRPADGVIVAPDVGAAKLAETYARLLALPVAIVHKTRTGPAAVTASTVSGEVSGKTPIVIDDMISTGGTIEAAIEAVAALGARRGGTIVAASHGLFVDGCVERLRSLDLARLFVTDSIAFGLLPGLPVATVSVASVLGDCIRTLADAS
jgi:ribose-phosphate pyrophosphokinase